MQSSALFRSGFVALVGRPNAGKSTLLNRLLGSELSIVSPKAQTTRERVLGIWTRDEIPGQIVFVDTPGIHQAKEGGLNEWMVAQAREALGDVREAWYLVDPFSELKFENAVVQLLSEGLKERGTPIRVLVNKWDRVGSHNARVRAQALGSELKTGLETLGFKLVTLHYVSAQEGRNLDEITTPLWERLPEGPKYYQDSDQLSDRPVRFFVAEKIREQLFMSLGDELPYSCAVRIDRFDENAKPVPRIEATIVVERESQKPMLIGKGGQKIKEIGQTVRPKVEAFVGTKVFLGLRVEVIKNWTRDKAAMERLGYV